MAAGFTVTDKRSVPLELMEPSVTEMLTISAEYRLITPLLDPATFATPFVNFIVVVVEKLRATPALSTTLGAVTGLGDGFAPEKTRFFNPLYPVNTAPAAVLAVIVRFFDCPAVHVTVESPAMRRTSLVACA